MSAPGAPPWGANPARPEGHASPEPLVSNGTLTQVMQNESLCDTGFKQKNILRSKKKKICGGERAQNGRQAVAEAPGGR